MINLIHFKKTKGVKSEIAIDEDISISNNAFAVYGVEKDAKFGQKSIGWRLPVADTDGQYLGHRFELIMSLAVLDKFIEAAQWARAQADQTEPPNEIGEIKTSAEE